MAQECESLFQTNSTYLPRKVYYDYFFEYQSPGLYPSDTHFETKYGINVSWNYSSWYIPGSTSANYLTYQAANATALGRASNLDLIFQNVHLRAPEFRWLYLAFEDDLFINYPGSIVGGTDSERSNPSTQWHPTGDDWYQTLKAGNGRMVFVNPYYDPIENVLLVTIGRAVHDANGHMMGVIAGDISVQDIRTKILDVHVLQTGYAALITNTGGVVAHPGVQDKDYAWYGAALPPLTDFEVNTPGNTPALTSAQMAQITSGTSGITQYQRNGNAFLLAYTPVGIGTYICIIIVPVSEAKAAIPILQQRIQAANIEAVLFIVGITGVGIAVAALVAGAVSGQITRPLQYLMELATKNVTAMIKQQPLNSQDLQVDKEFTAKDDEIGELARAFQGMLSTIKEEDKS
jgi:HAMP domain-containing protein